MEARPQWFKHKFKKFPITDAFLDEVEQSIKDAEDDGEDENGIYTLLRDISEDVLHPFYYAFGHMDGLADIPAYLLEDSEDDE